ncbi:MAG: NAD(P)-dependent oxidoreductase [Chloroflexota bacterium]|nr:NAD(P)-dependent oxidoreductase [Chloroflexota bacterium]
MDALPASSGSLNVYINGGTTPAGRALVRQLVAAGHRVTATAVGSVDGGILRADGALPAYPNLTRMGELRSAIAAAKASVVVNLAPTYPYQVPQRATEWDAYTSVVSDGTKALLEAAQAQGVEYVVQASFSFLGGDAHAHGHDDHEPPTAPFIDAAREAEAAVNAYGIPATLLRFGFIYSAESPALHELRNSLLRSRPLVPGSDHTRANWVHAEDAARAIVLAIAVRPVGETLYVVDDKPATPAAFLQNFAGQLGVGAPGQMPLLMRGLFAGATQQAMMEQPSGASNAETKARLGWTLKYPTLTQGLEQSLMVWRAQEPIVQ